MIRLDNIEVSFGDFTAIPGLDLHVLPGEFFTLLGPSGCGKTTALRTLAGFIQPSNGTVASLEEAKAAFREKFDRWLEWAKDLGHHVMWQG